MDNYKELPREVDKLKDLLEEKSIPSHPYRFCIFAINTKQSLESKNISPESGYGEKLYNIYNTNIYPLVSKIEKEIQFFSFLKQDIYPEYELLIHDIQKIFNKQILTPFKNIWKLDGKEKFFLIPNVLSVGHSFGLFRKNNIYSISSPIKDREGKVDFNSQNLISNTIHEYSHCILQRGLIAKGKYGQVREALKDIEIPDTLQKIHARADLYIEENFINSITLFIQEETFKNFMSKTEIEEKRKDILDSLVKRGYTFTPLFYSKMTQDSDPLDIYLKIVEKFS